MPNVKTLVFIIDKPLHGDIRAQEFLDMAMMAAAFGQRVVVVFEGSGVYGLIKEQRADVLGLKNITPVLSALSVYDIHDILVEQESMLLKGVDESQLGIAVSVQSRSEIKQTIDSANHLFSF